MAWTRYMSEHQLGYSVHLNKNNMRSVGKLSVREMRITANVLRDLFEEEE